ncbi:MAG: 2,3,4,5-tetrahydropyridine-2,6-dicarboxylate N-succinyltransferase, partial [Robiginitomaculum sp.]|nr:2,3,4,5-tetrahydropyridine-2,6-dicarboxylate N-succinyltransferase [Robiginitomaculum sp.]
MTNNLQNTIETAWDNKSTLSVYTKGETRDAVQAAIAGLDSGKWRVASKSKNGDWTVHQWLKKAVLLGFRLNPMQAIEGGAGGAMWWDKVAGKFAGWDAGSFKQAGLRAVPGALARHGCYIGKDVVLMPSFVNIGAYVGDGTMVDTWASIGSCAQVGAHCHISAGTGVG